MRLTKAVDLLKNGESFKFRGRGNSMTPYLKNKELVWARPIDREIKVGDIVLARVHGKHMEHFVSAIQGDRYQISNAHGHVNGWTTRNHIYGFIEKYEGQDT